MKNKPDLTRKEAEEQRRKLKGRSVLNAIGQIYNLPVKRKNHFNIYRFQEKLKI
jgi:hypothetical protein